MSHPATWTPAPGDIVDRYRLITQLGRGGMASVFLACRDDDAGFRRLLAIKFVRAHLLDDEEVRAMFVDEAAISSSLSHANIVQVFDVGTHQGTPFMVMEYLQGQVLGALVKRTLGTEERPIAPLLHALGQAAEGLHAAHEACDVNGRHLEIIHRDVNPRNLHVGYGGHVKVVDFGVASARQRTSRTRTGEVKGTLSYLAPEQLRGGIELDRRVDVWALGVVAWEALAGRRLFRGESDARSMWNITNLDPPSLHTEAGIDRELSDVIAQCLQKDRELRPTSMRVLADAFHAAAQTRPATTRELSALVTGLFAEEQTRRSEEIAAALAGPRASVEQQTAPTARMMETETSKPPALPQSAPPRARWALALVLAVSCLALALAWWMRAPTVNDPLPTAVPPRAAEARPTQQPPSATPIQPLTNEANEANEANVEAPEQMVTPMQRTSMRRESMRRVPMSTSMARTRYIPEAPYQ